MDANKHEWDPEESAGMIHHKEHKEHKEYAGMWGLRPANLGPHPHSELLILNF